MAAGTRSGASARTAARAVCAVGILLAAAVAWATGVEPVEGWNDPDDPILHGDPVDASTGWPAFMLPGVPWIEAGPDGSFGTEDDRIDTSTTGDIDIFVETGVDGSVPVGVCEPFGLGVSIPFTVRPSDGKGATAKPPDYFEGLPLLGVAFADLDGDGFIGVTRLDGDASDDRLEAAELRPVGRRYAHPASDGSAVGELVVTTGGPPGHELRIAIAAVGYAGPFSPDYLGGRVPEGPAIATRLPFLPMTDPFDAMPLATLEVLAADPDGRVAVQARIALDPDPTHPVLGEAFTLRLDGSDGSIGLALARSGPAARFGVAVEPNRETYLPLDSRPLRLAVDDSSEMMPVEIARRVLVADDGGASQTKIRIVALDRLGNVTAPDRPTQIRLKVDKGFVIVRPDEDGKERYEEFTLADARGVEVILDDLKEEFDNESVGRLRIRSEGRVERIDLVSPDPDIDESGHVDAGDLIVFGDCLGFRDGDPGFVPQLDLDANGRIDGGDLDIAIREFGRKVKKDGRSKVKPRDGACFDGKKRKLKD